MVPRSRQVFRQLPYHIFPSALCFMAQLCPGEESNKSLSGIPAGLEFQRQALLASFSHTPACSVQPKVSLASEIEKKRKKVKNSMNFKPLLLLIFTHHPAFFFWVSLCWSLILLSVVSRTLLIIGVANLPKLCLFSVSEVQITHSSPDFLCFFSWICKGFWPLSWKLFNIPGSNLYPLTGSYLKWLQYSVIKAKNNYTIIAILIFLK